MVGFVLVVLVIANLVLLVPVVVFAVEVFAAATRRSLPGATSPDVRPSAAILVPAHDEEDGIGETVIALRRQLRPGDRLLVVADNCSDATAAKAREAGAEVVERRDVSARGKGYALDFGIRHLGEAPPQAVVIVDADCRLDPGCVDRLAARAAATRRPVQGLNLMSVPPGGGLNLQVAELAFLIKNHVRPAGLHRLGLPCHLTGTGMAFPWAIIRDADLAHASLVEDMKLGLDLARRGTPALFCEDARISSHFPYTQEGASSQRRRWEEGHIGMIASGIGQLPAALRSGRADVIAVALDVLVPPLTLLLMLMTAGFVVTAVLTFALSLGQLALIVSGFGLALFVIAALVAWGVFGRDALPPRSLLRVVPYVLRKLALYPKLAFGSRSGAWVRTDRKRGE